MIYPFPVVVTFQATVTIEDQFLGLEIDPTEKTLAVGQKQDFTVYAKWNIDGAEKRFEVTNDKLLWSSDAPSKSPVDSTGLVTGVQAIPGTSYATIKATFTAQNASVTAKVWVIDSGGGGSGGTGGGTIHVRHMVRNSPTDSYVQNGAETVISVATLPDTRTLNADTSRGTVMGKSLSYFGYVNSVSSGSSATVNLTSANKEAWVSFYYQKPVEVTGDFDVLPDNIPYGDPFKLHPKDFKFVGCTYKYHYFKIERDGSSWTGPNVYGQTTVTSYTRSTYPWVIGAGTHNVYLKIVTSCGESNWIGPKSLIVTNPSNNNPPQFQIAWVRPNEPTKPVTEAIENETLNLTVIQDPTVPTPTDPDGDTISFDGYDFATSDSWTQQIPSKYDDHYMSFDGIKMDGLGTHYICGQMRDQWGATTKACTYVNVVPPNPVPVITGLSEVVEDRPLSTPFSANNSYSPVGRSIDHSRDEWTNKKDVYTTPGTEIITLDVFDSIGLKSVKPAQHTLTVREDLPPVPVLNFATPSVRNVPTVFQERSYSPDGDNIVEKTVSYRYDSDNDGVFTDETKVNVTPDSSRNFTFTPTKIGKYRFTVFVKEDWGKSASKDFDFQVVNDAPTRSFDISTESTPPQPIITVPMKPAVLTDTTSGSYVNSDTVTSPKTDSWASNPSNGALVHSPTNEGIYSLVSGPNPGAQVTVSIPYYASGGDQFYNSWRFQEPIFLTPDAYIVQRWNSYGYSGIDSDWTIYVVKRNADGSWPSYSFVRSGENGAGEAVFYVDYAKKQIVTKSLYYSSWNSSLNRYKYYTYNFDEFLNSSAGPVQTNMDHPPSVGGTKYLNGYPSTPSKTGERVFWADSNDKYYYSAITWDSGIEQSRTEISQAIYYLMRTTGSHDLDMNYYGKLYSGYVDSYWDKGYYRYNPDTNTVLNHNVDVTVNYNDSFVVPIADGKFVMGQQGHLFHSTDYSLAANPPKLGLNVSKAGFKNIAILCDSNLCYGYKVNSDATFSQLWSASRYVNSYGSSVIDNHGYIYYQDSDKVIKRLRLETGAIENIAALGEYVGSFKLLNDGYLSVTSSVGQYYKTYLIYTSSLPQSNKPAESQNQLISKTVLKDVQISYTIRMNHLASDRLYTGFVFHAQDNVNMYRVEHNGKEIRLVRCSGGVRAVLASAPYIFEQSQKYTVKIRVLDGRITVYVGGAPVLDKTDTTYEKGRFGPFSELPRSEFFNMSYADLTSISSSSQLKGIALVGQDMVYTVTDTDTENDPMIQNRTEWTYTKTQEKFLNAGDGKSGPSVYEGNVYRTPVAGLDKVGVYTVSSRTADDPNSSYPYPSLAFNSYRQSSNTAVRTLIVHRPPIVDYDISLNPDKTVKWTDRSRDPDRYLGASNYSTENTGIDYLRTKGILEKKFYYVTPSGETVIGKLVTPDETGLYTVGMAVKDEYEAWSPFLERTIVIDALPSPDEPPHAGFTPSQTTAYRGTPVTIDSTAWDKEDGARQNLPHEYYIKNVDGGTETLQSTVRSAWTKTFGTLGTFQIRQVVEDRLGQVDQAVRTIEIVNRLPYADVYVPNSSDQNNPVKITVLRPAFKWNYGDADGDAESKFQVRIYRYGGLLEQDSGIRSGSDLLWTPTDDLPEHVNMYVQVRVYDGYDWSAWSAAKFFYIETNRPPTADFDWSPKPVYEGDTLTIATAVGDPDNDILSVSFTVKGPNSGTQTFAYSRNSPYSSAGPVLTGVNAGTYQIELAVSDGKAAPVTVRKSVTVLPLAVNGQVKHTDLWDERRKEYNKKESGSENSPRGYGVFWAGEKFVLAAQTTDTGTATKAVRVEAAMGGMSVTLDAQNAGQTVWSGEMWEERFEQLADGPITFVFKATYNNGTVKTTSVTVTIAGDVGETFGVHRRM